MRLLAIFLSLVALLMAEAASAGSMWKPQFGPPPFAISVNVLRTYGTGCPQGIVSAAMSPDNSTISILFDQLGTNIPATSVLLQDRKTCSIALAIDFRGQYRVAIVGSDIRGFANVPANASSSIQVKHQSIFDPGGRYAAQMNFQRQIVGPAEQNIEMVNRFPQKPIWSQCGTQNNSTSRNFPFMTVVIDINSQNANPENDLIAAVDSFDFSAAPLSYQIAWTADRKNCPR